MRNVFLLLLLILSTQAFGQVRNNKYGLLILDSKEELLNTVKQDSNKLLVKIKDFVPTITLDIKYATTQNVFYEQLYPKAHAFTRRSAAIALAKVQEELKQHGVGIKIYDGYRPYSVTCRMWERLPDTIYMGKPWQGSNHNRGIALDLTLIDLDTKKELAMPTPFDALVYASHPNFMLLPDSVIKNRELLISTMNSHGFQVDPVEWWHFNYRDGKTYELLDVSPEVADEIYGQFTRKKRKK